VFISRRLEDGGGFPLFDVLDKPFRVLWPNHANPTSSSPVRLILTGPSGPSYRIDYVPFTLRAAANEAWRFLLSGGTPMAVIGFVVGSAVTDLRQHRKSVQSSATVSRHPASRSIWIRVFDFVVLVLLFLHLSTYQ
jgi:hypothetical protein